MAPVTLKKLLSLQQSRIDELTLTSTRLREKDRGSFNAAIVAARLDDINKIRLDFRRTHDEIIMREDAADSPYITENAFAAMQILHEEMTDFLLTIQSEVESQTQNESAVRGLNDSSFIDFELRAAKLPKLDLPTFSGRYEDWENFCDLFTTLVHNAPRLADATKLQYLKSCLRDSAADLVKDVATTNANYATTWQALKVRFHNPRLIVFNHLRALMDIVPLKRESASELRAFADESQRIVRALKNLKMPVESWDIWFVFVLSSRLDSDSRKAWEMELSLKDRSNFGGVGSRAVVEENPLSPFPKFTEFAEFLENRARTLGMIASESNRAEKRPAPASKVTPIAKRVHVTSTFHKANERKIKCPLCSGEHRLFKCNKFKTKSVHDRRAEVRRLQLCFNCFGLHRAAECTSTFRCQHCKDKHHSLLHVKNPGASQSTQNLSTFPSHATGSSTTTTVANVLTTSIQARTGSVLLATAQIQIIGPNGMRTRVRALLDQGSEISLISNSIAKLLNLPKRHVGIPLAGVGGTIANTAHLSTKFTIQSIQEPTFQLEVEALLLPQLTAELPARQCIEGDFAKFSGLTLADPQFLRPGSVDVILGADVYGQILRPGLKRFPSTLIVAQESVFGWVLSGPLHAEDPRRAGWSPGTPKRSLHCAVDSPLEKLLLRFWTIEEVPEATSPSPDDMLCENLFKDTYFRKNDGRFVVRLPFRSELPEVGLETRRIALNSLSRSHQRFYRDPMLADAYHDFMRTYEELGHMERVAEHDIANPKAWYLPHHAVVSSTPTNSRKIRVVFDASRKTKENHCLNNFLLPGPALQRDLSLILLNWRRYRYVFTADIVKMFRQIEVARQDQDLQRIVWSPSSSESPVDYRLTTVTYGTACAPYLAIRTLDQLAADEKSRFPLGAECLETNIYVDDTFSGADELSKAVQIRQELIDLLHSAKIDLDKWAANHPELLPANSENDRIKEFDFDQSIKTLGVHWNPRFDAFQFVTSDPKALCEASTKRAMFSNIARLFDPLGWLVPVTVTAKVLMQDLWIVRSEWDAPLPSEIRDRWLEYCQSLSALPDISVPRWLHISAGSNLQIHGFSDASRRAYAAAVYLRARDSNGTFRVYLLIAKSKVAPVKTVSIPNLELCGAVLLVKLLRHIQSLEFLRDAQTFAWTDSQIILTWLNKHPSNWKTFVANRVSYIQTALPMVSWSHVPTKQNPADLGTRGCKPLELQQSKLWWNGPEWLTMSEEFWPKAATAAQVLNVQAVSSEPEIIKKFSSLKRLLRVVAYCLRPLRVVRARLSNTPRLPNFLTATEISKAFLIVTRLTQEHAFPSEMTSLKANKNIAQGSPLMGLRPYYDAEDKILRVGGRLSHSTLTEAQKHPPILPRRSALSRLVVRFAHRSCLHGGPTLTSSRVLHYAWILGRNHVVKTEIKQCIPCQRVKPRLASQLMGNLPSDRVTVSRPFSIAGLDYAGPFMIRTTKGRGFKSYKGYIALFVCFVTRAVHLEVVSDLTTQTFLAAFRRFVGRRGVCHKLFSDNATTFQAADKQLKGMFNCASEFYGEVASTLSNDGTTWTFIPPNSPHYGGLWEAGVRSVKHHIKRSFGDQAFTFEEFSTILVEIEACLNSRPLRPLSSDLDDLNALTPAHFLLGESSGIVPDQDYSVLPGSSLDRYHQVQSVRNHFWNRWSSEYMQHMQERGKWRKPTENFAVGQLVLVRDDRYPPTKWPLGRVIEVHSGPDSLVRVVTIKTATSTLRRHIARLAPLILESAKSEKTPSN